MSRPSIKTIAKQVGVSKTTVSFVLNGRGDEKNISPVTQKKIMDCAATHNYRPNYLARSLSLGKSHTIGFIVPDISNPFFGKIIKFVERYAEKKGYSVTIASTDEDTVKEVKVVEGFKSRQIDGLIIAPAAPSVERMKAYQGNGSFPVICFDRIDSHLQKGYVDIDNLEATQELAQVLINKGHKRIAALTLTSHLPNISQRLEGYKKALTQNNLPVDEQLIVEIDYHNKKQDVQSALQLLLTLEEPVTSILFLNNVLAAEGIWTVNKYHKEKLHQLEFASFDNLDLFDYALPKVTSVLQPAELIAEHCVEMLCDEIEHKMHADGITLKSKIIER